MKATEINGVAVGPINLTPDERMALEIYHDAVAFSGVDANGLPLITNLQFAIEAAQLNQTPDERYFLCQRVKMIAAKMRAEQAAKLRDK